MYMYVYVCNTYICIASTRIICKCNFVVVVIVTVEVGDVCVAAAVTVGA